jgi:hypothetical protein
VGKHKEKGETEQQHKQREFVKRQKEKKENETKEKEKAGQKDATADTGPETGGKDKDQDKDKKTGDKAPPPPKKKRPPPPPKGGRPKPKQSKEDAAKAQKQGPPLEDRLRATAEPRPLLVQFRFKTAPTGTPLGTKPTISKEVFGVACGDAHTALIARLVDTAGTANDAEGVEAHELGTEGEGAGEGSRANGHGPSVPITLQDPNAVHVNGKGPPELEVQLWLWGSNQVCY